MLFIQAIFTGLISPYEENRAVLMYVNSTKNRAVLFGYTLNVRYGETFNRVRLQGLDPAKTYKVQEINVSDRKKRPGLEWPGMSESGRSYTGDYLMKVGLNIGSTTPLTSTVYEIIGIMKIKTPGSKEEMLKLDVSFVMISSKNRKETAEPFHLYSLYSGIRFIRSFSSNFVCSKIQIMPITDAIPTCKDGQRINTPTNSRNVPL